MSPSIGFIIGGSSCVGKTTLAKSLCARFDLALVQTDGSLPDNQTINPLAGPLEIWDRAPEQLCELLVVAAAAATPYLALQIEVLSASNQGWIVEGERINPELVQRVERGGSGRGIFIVETDAERLHNTLVKRLPGFGELSKSRQRAVAELDRLYNLWLISEASRRHLPCVASQPWQTLADRTLDVLFDGASPDKTVKRSK
jgi:2-phosphoglycerate kinase